MKRFFKIIFIIFFLLFLYTCICAYSYSQSTLCDIQQAVFRLHVIANSNSQEDQELKLIVRDRLLDYMNSLCVNCNSKGESMAIAEEHKKDFEQIAQNTINELGYSYSVKVNIGNFEFPTKKYGDITLPSGYYDAIRVEIGSAEGENWWCVMFPPLCFVDISSGVVPDKSKEMIKNTLSEEEFSLISNQDSNYSIQFKFKLLELFKKENFITAKR